MPALNDNYSITDKVREVYDRIKENPLAMKYFQLGKHSHACYIVGALKSQKVKENG